MPGPLQREVYDFVRFLKVRSQEESVDGLRLSGAVLSKDCETPEEDAARATL